MRIYKSVLIGCFVFSIRPRYNKACSLAQDIFFTHDRRAEWSLPI